MDVGHRRRVHDDRCRAAALGGTVRDEPVARDLCESRRPFLDGASQTLITRARDANGQLARMCPCGFRFSPMARLPISGRFRRARWSLAATGARRSPTQRLRLSAGAIPRLQLSVTPTGTDASAHVDRGRHRPVGAAGLHRLRSNRSLQVPSANARGVPECALDGSTSTPGAAEYYGLRLGFRR